MPSLLSDKGFGFAFFGILFQLSPSCFEILA